jgi:predicted ribosomally synthesized peptide with SipW-like signal peptide
VDEASSHGSRLRSRRVRALLASGLVLGVGGAVTLAAWNDSEHATAAFTASRFGIVGWTGDEQTSFDDHATREGAAALAFSPAGPLAPGTTMYALFSVRTLDASVAGPARLTADAANSGVGTLGQYLSYGVTAISDTACDATTFSTGTTVIPPGSPLTTSATASQPLEADGANQVNYCFAITMPANTPSAAQGLGQTARWEIVAASS